MLFVLGGLQGVLGWYMVKSGCAAVVNGSLVCEPENGPGRKGAGLKTAPAGHRTCRQAVTYRLL